MCYVSSGGYGYGYGGGDGVGRGYNRAVIHAGSARGGNSTESDTHSHTLLALFCVISCIAQQVQTKNKQKFEDYPN